jgi:DNA-binding CsgD family transcriptional regulator
MYTTAGPATIVTADFDGDGKPDLAIIDVLIGRVTVWRGDGHGGFGPARDLARRARQERELESPDRLTAREAEVAALVAGGYTDREIAAELGIGCRTVETHAANIRAKLGLKSRRELIRRAAWPAV